MAAHNGYNPAHDAFVMYALEPGTDGSTIVESTTSTATQLPTAPTTLIPIGYTPVPEGRRGLNNSYGYAVGSAAGAYRKRSRVEPGVTFSLAGGSTTFLTGIKRTLDVSPYFALWVGVPGQWTDIYRYCKWGTLGIQGQENSEVRASVQIEAMAAFELASPLNPDLSVLNDLGTPLMWHDVRNFSIENSAGVITDYRKSLMGFNVNISNNLERKGERPDWGDNEPTSRTCYHLLEHQITVSGDITLHRKLDKAMFQGAARAQDWGTIAVAMADLSDTTTIDLSCLRCIPVDETKGGGEPGQQLTRTIPFVASDYTLAATDATS